jgi:hypothetical protein
MFSHLLLVTSTTIQAATYALAAAYARHSDHHREMCPFYVLSAVAVLLHLIVVLIQWRQAGSNHSNHAMDDHHAPIGHVKRSTYYDDRGAPFFTEWQALPNAPTTVEQMPGPSDTNSPADDERAA